MTTISIDGLEPAAVLAALYNRATPLGMGFLHYDPTPMTVEHAQALLDQGERFDYVYGRPIKIRMTTQLDVRLYDRDNGTGAAASAIQALRETGDVNAPKIREAHQIRMASVIRDTEEHLGDPTVVTDSGVHMGLSDVANVLRPAIERAKDSGAI